MEMWPKDAKTVRGTGFLGGEGVDVAGSVTMAEPFPVKCSSAEERAGQAVAAAGASAEPLPPPEDTTETEAKAVLAVGKISPRPGRRSTVVTEAVIQAISPNKLKGCQSSFVAHVRENRENPKSERSSPPKTALSGRGTSPPNDIGSRRRTSVKPQGLGKKYSSVLDQGAATRPIASVFCGGRWKTGQKISFDVQRTFVRLETEGSAADKRQRAHIVIRLFLDKHSTKTVVSVALHKQWT